MNILITGCNGQLGTCLRTLQPQYSQHQWFNTDVAQLDITSQADVERFVNEHEIDGIINCAAYTAVDKAESDEALAQRLNAEAPAFLAHAVDQRGGFIIQISTDYVFDGTAHQPYTEDDETNPQSVYGRTKLVGELNVLKLCRRAMVIRTAWLYSPYGKNFVKTMLRLAQERDELNVVADQHGSPTSADDLAEAIMHIVEQGIQPGTYHFTNEGATTWYDFTREILRISGINCRVNPLQTSQYPTPAVRPAYSVLSKEKIKNTFHLHIPHWQEALEKVLLTHPNLKA